MDKEFVLVDRYDNIRNRVELPESSDVKSYFIKVKQIDEKAFDKIWKIMSLNEYDRIHKQGLQNRQIEWWKEEDGLLDIEKL